MALEFCVHEDVVFDDAPLVVVLTQVKFSPILSLLTLAGVAGFQASLRDEYPTMLERAQQPSVLVGPNVVGAQQGSPIWRFTDDSKQWVVGLAADFVSLETPKYTDIEEFLGRFQHILDVLRRVVRPGESLRIGLRKINTFEAPGRDTAALLSMLRPELLGLVGVERFPAPLGGAASQVGFQDDENTLMVRSGLENPMGREVVKFSLDLDYYTERPYQIGGDRSMIELMKYFSDGMTSFFHWTLLDSYRETLHPHARREEQSK